MMDNPLISQALSMMSPIDSEQVSMADQPANQLVSSIPRTNKSREKEVEMILRNRGLNSEAVAGVMSNIDVETGGTFNYLQEQGGGGPGRGLFQLDPSGPLPAAYSTWKAVYELPDSPESQIDFMLETIYGKKDLQSVVGLGHASKLRKSFGSDNARGVSKEFMKRWENPGIPHKSKRLKSADKYSKRFKEAEDPYTVDRGGKSYANVTAEQLEKSGLSLGDYMKTWKGNDGVRP